MNGPWPASLSDAELQTLHDHVSRCLGPPRPSVIHEIASDLVHLDVLHFPPNAGRSFHVLLTVNMSARSMTPPPEHRGERFAELMIALPSEWPVMREKADRHDWPLRWLKTLGRLPHETGSWLWEGHTVATDDPPRPVVAGASFCGFLLAAPSFIAMEDHVVRVSTHRSIRFFVLVPLFEDEIQYKLDQGAEALLAKLDERGVSQVVSPDRKSVISSIRR